MTNTATRVLVAFIAIPCILFIAFVGGYAWFVFVAILMLLALQEYYHLAESKGAHPQKLIGSIISLFLLCVFIHERIRNDIITCIHAGIIYPSQWQAFMIIIVLSSVIILLVELFRNYGSAINNLGATFLGIFYIGLFAGTAIGIREIFTISEFPVGRFYQSITLNEMQLSQLHRWGGYTIAAILTTIWLCDTAAYFGGRAFGVHKLFERVSPKKTWEGALFGFIAAVCWMILVKYFFLDYLTLVHAVIIGIIIGTIGQMGDLVESLLKRDAQIKDSSVLIPGHGGVFDRFDSFLFVSPLIFLYLDFIVFA